MKVTVEKIQKTKVALDIEVEKEKVEEALENAYRKVVKRVVVPGFRKGKAPRHILEARLGREVLYEEALDELISRTYPEALKEAAVEAVGEPQISIVQMEAKQPLLYKATVFVKPEIELPEYSGIEIEGVEGIQVTEEDVQEELEKLQRRMARLVDLDAGNAELGDIVRIDFTGYIDGEPFPGGSATNYSLELGSGTFIPGFEEQLVGMGIGEEKEIRVTFPENYSVAELAGKEASFRVKVNGISRKEMDPIDDEFAKDVSEFETLEELKADIAKNLQERYDSHVQEELRKRLMDKLIEMTDVEVPLPLVNRRMQEMIEQFERTLGMQGLALEDYLKGTGQTVESILDEFRVQATKWVQTALILESIARKENLEVSDEEVEQEVNRWAQKYQLKPEQLPSFREKVENSLREDLLVKKATDLLLKQVRILPPAETGAESAAESAGESK